MATPDDTLENNLGEALQSELSRPSEARRPMSGGEAVRAPRRIPGGFAGLSSDLERRARDLSNMLRVLEQERPQVEAAQARYTATHEALARAVAEAQQAGQVLDSMLQNTMAGDVSEELGAQFTRNLKALEELESVTQTLTANLLWVRSTWEQYARSIIRAQKMREALPADASER